MRWLISFARATNLLGYNLHWGLKKPVQPVQPAEYKHARVLSHTSFARYAHWEWFGGHSILGSLQGEMTYTNQLRTMLHWLLGWIWSSNGKEDVSPWKVGFGPHLEFLQYVWTMDAIFLKDHFHHALQFPKKHQLQYRVWGACTLTYDLQHQHHVTHAASMFWWCCVALIQHMNSHQRPFWVPLFQQPLFVCHTDSPDMFGVHRTLGTRRMKGHLDDPSWIPFKSTIMRCDTGQDVSLNCLASPYHSTTNFCEAGPFLCTAVSHNSGCEVFKLFDLSLHIWRGKGTSIAWPYEHIIDIGYTTSTETHDGSDSMEGHAQSIDGQVCVELSELETMINAQTSVVFCFQTIVWCNSRLAFIKKKNSHAGLQTSGSLITLKRFPWIQTDCRISRCNDNLLNAQGNRIMLLTGWVWSQNLFCCSLATMINSWIHSDWYTNTLVLNYFLAPVTIKYELCKVAENFSKSGFQNICEDALKTETHRIGICKLASGNPAMLA